MNFNFNRRILKRLIVSEHINRDDIFLNKKKNPKLDHVWSESETFHVSWWRHFDRSGCESVREQEGEFGGIRREDEKREKKKRGEKTAQSEFTKKNLLRNRRILKRLIVSEHINRDDIFLNKKKKSKT